MDNKLREDFEVSHTKEGNPKNKVKCKRCGDILAWDQAYLDETGANSPRLIFCKCGATAIDPSPFATRLMGDGAVELAVGGAARLKDIVLNTDFESVWDTLRKYYTEWDKSGCWKDVNLNKQRKCYKRVFNKLRKMQTKKVDKWLISVVWHRSPADEVEEFGEGEEYYVVDALRDGKNRAKRYGLEATKWKKWLGMRIELHSLRKYPPADIVAACLYEMTFFGVSHKRWKKNIKKFKRRLKK